MSEMNCKKMVKVRFENPDSIKELVDTLSHCSAAAEFVSNNQKVDATSLMGIFTLNVLEPLKLNIRAVSEEILDKTIEAIDGFLVRE